MNDRDLHALEALATVDDTPAVSIFLAAAPVGASMDWRRLRLRGLLDDAAGQLAAAGVSRKDIDELVEAVTATCTGIPPTGARAVYAAGSQATVFDLRHDVPADRVFVDSRFRLAPTLVDRLENPSYLLLALDLDAPRLYRGDAFQLQDITSQVDMESLEALAEREERRPTRQLHEVGVTGGPRHGIVHGHGGAKDVRKDMVERWLRSLDDAISDLKDAENPPLVLAGVGWQVATFRGTSRYPLIADDAIIGSPTGLTSDELHQAATAAALPVLRRRADQDLARLQRALGTNRATTNSSLIARYAIDGGVQAVFVEHDADLFDELLDVAVTASWRTGAAVHVVDDGTFRTTKVAALLRW